MIQNRQSRSEKFGDLEPLIEEDDQMSFHMTEHEGIRRAEIERIEAKCAQQEEDMGNERIDTE